MGLTNYNKVKEALNTHAYQVGRVGAKSKVIRCEIDGEVYFAKQLLVPYTFRRPANALVYLSLEDGINQVFCHAVLRDFLGPPQPNSYYYFDQDTQTAWLLVEEIAHDPEHLSFFPLVKEVYDKLGLLQEVSDFVKRLSLALTRTDSDELSCLSNEREFLAKKVPEAADLFAYCKRHLVKGLVAKHQAFHQAAIRDTRQQMDQLICKLTSDPQHFYQHVVTLLLLARLFDEDDFSLKNLMLAKQGDSYQLVYYDIDLILTYFSNFIASVGHPHPRAMGPLTIEDLLHQTVAKAKFNLDGNERRPSIFEGLLTEEMLTEAWDELSKYDFSVVSKVVAARCLLPNPEADFTRRHIEIVQQEVSYRRDHMRSFLVEERLAKTQSQVFTTQYGEAMGRIFGNIMAFRQARTSEDLDRWILDLSQQLNKPGMTVAALRTWAIQSLSLPRHAQQAVGIQIIQLFNGFAYRGNDTAAERHGPYFLAELQGLTNRYLMQHLPGYDLVQNAMHFQLIDDLRSLKALLAKKSYRRTEFAKSFYAAMMDIIDRFIDSCRDGFNWSHWHKEFVQLQKSVPQFQQEKPSSQTRIEIGTRLNRLVEACQYYSKIGEVPRQTDLKCALLTFSPAPRGPEAVVVFGCSG